MWPQEALAPLEGADRLAFLDFGELLAAVSWAEARSYFESGAILVAGIHPSHTEPILGPSLVVCWARRGGERLGPLPVRRRLLAYWMRASIRCS